jgi:hypothetical protein
MSVESGTLTGELSSARYGPVRRAIGKAMYWRYRLLQRHRHEDVVLEHVDGLPLLIMPGVLNPNLMRTGAFFAAQLGPDLIGAHAEVLDMGTGSGVCAVVAARYARHVVAVDINPSAWVICSIPCRAVVSTLFYSIRRSSALLHATMRIGRGAHWMSPRGLPRD